MESFTLEGGCPQPPFSAVIQVPGG